MTRATPFSLDADATDADLDTLTYSATGLPGGLTINAATGVISGTLSGTAPASTRSRSPCPTALDTDTDTSRWTVNDVDRRRPPRPAVAAGANGSVGLTWNANGEPDLAGYHVFRGTSLPV